MIKSARATLRAHRESIKLPKSTQDLLPFRRAWQDGTFVCGDVFSRTYRITDINYSVASMEDKRAMFLDYSSFLNAIDVGCIAKLTIFNRRIDRAGLEADILLPLQGDDLDKYRIEYNDMLTMGAMGKNAIVQEKYITLSIAKKSVEEANAWMNRAGTELTGNLALLDSVATPLDARDRLRVIHDLYHPGKEGGFAFDYKAAQKNGHSVADAVAPDSFENIDGKTIKLGDRYARALFIRDFATYIKDTMITEFCDLPKTMMLSIDILPVPTDEALSEIERRVMGVDTDITNWQRSQNKGGNFSAEIPPHLERARKESRELEDDLTTRDQRLFFGFVSIFHTADSREELGEDTESLLAISRKHLCQLAPMTFRQIEGMQTAMPFGVCRVGEDEFRTLNTESLAVLHPWKAQEIRHKGGTYYGQNAISKNMILIDQSALLNGNSVILGSSGSGKSMIAKAGMLDKMLNSNDEILVVDPESEYAKLALAMGGSVIRVAADSANHINALDMSEGYGDGVNGIQLKAEFMLSLVEQCIGVGKLGAKEKSLIDRSIAAVYHNYIQSGYRGESPTLQDFHDELLRQPEPEARGVALAMELFTKGSLNIFAHKTNVDVQNRITVFDIRDLGKQLKTIGMLVVLDSIFNRLLRNRAQGRRTWILIDELYLMFSNEYSANYLFELWKRIRKYGGYACGITQNVGDMLQSHTARAMLANSEFLVILNQSGTDRMELAKLLNISDTQLSHITNASAGKGLIKCGASIVPFEHNVPRHSELYQLLSIKFNEK